jgi:hypothetical protein
MSQTHFRRGFSLPGYNLEVHSYRDPSVHMCGLGSGTQGFTCENRSIRSAEGSADSTQQNAFVPDCDPLTGVNSFFPESVRDGLYPWGACSTLAGCTFTEHPSMLEGGGLSYPVTLVFSEYSSGTTVPQTTFSDCCSALRSHGKIVREVVQSC